MIKRCVLTIVVFSVVAGVSSLTAQSPEAERRIELQPDGKGNRTLQQHHPEGGAHAIQPHAFGTNGIQYHGGPLMLGNTNVYIIWYGNWANRAATSLLPQLAAHIGGSSYFNINTTYYDGNHINVSNSITYKGSATDNYSRGKAIGDADVQSIVQSAINAGHLPSDTHGVYFVITSADVNETSGFCTLYCGWHTSGSINGLDIKYAFVGDANRCMSACAAQPVGPNGTAAADAMASIFAHELEEAVTDPDLNAWYDFNGNENGDKCAWTFGSLLTAPNGARYNMTIGTRNYLIQQNWVNANGGFCAKSH